MNKRGNAKLISLTIGRKKALMTLLLYGNMKNIFLPMRNEKTNLEKYFASVVISLII